MSSGEHTVSTKATLLFESGLWRAAANCRNTDPDSFFPIGTTGNALSQIKAAKILCSKCTVQKVCLEFALVTNQDSGVWGGHSEEERRVMRRQRARTKRLEASRAKKHGAQLESQLGELLPGS